MKNRIISAAVALLIFIPIIIYGNLPYKIAMYILAILGLKEFQNAYSNKKQLPLFIQFISYLLMTLLVFQTCKSSNIIFEFDFRIIAVLTLAYLIPVIIYQDDKTYNIIDAFSLMGFISFLGTAFSLLILIRNIDLNTVIYLFLVTIFTDTYAYITGRLIGRHKLIEKISPNKTWEGIIGGTFIGTLVGSVFYVTLINPTISYPIIIFVTFLLSIIGEFGDLVFSAIKRHYGIKDFSNIMPGHGGILDRFDSIIFVALAFTLFINII